MARRNEDQLSLEIAKGGPGQPFDEGLALPAFALLIDGKQMTRPVIAILGPFGSRGLHDLGRHPIPTHRTAFHGISRENLHRAIERGRSAMIDQRPKPMIGVVMLVFAHMRTALGPQQHRGARRRRRIAIETTIRRKIR